MEDAITRTKLHFLFSTCSTLKDPGCDVRIQGQPLQRHRPIFPAKGLRSMTRKTKKNALLTFRQEQCDQKRHAWLGSISVHWRVKIIQITVLARPKTVLILIFSNFLPNGETRLTRFTDNEVDEAPLSHLFLLSFGKRFSFGVGGWERNRHFSTSFPEVKQPLMFVSNSNNNFNIAAFPIEKNSP